MAESITLDELLAELNRLDQREAVQGYSLRELMAKTGRSDEKTKDLIRRGKEAGLITVGRAPREALDGAMRPVPVYIFKPPEKSRGKVRAS